MNHIRGKVRANWGAVVPQVHAGVPIPRPIYPIARLLKPLVPPRAWQFFTAHVGVHEGLSCTGLSQITPVAPLQHQLEESHSRRVWLDVGAYQGEMTLPWAKRYRHLTVYAFEPNIPFAAQLVDACSNFVVIAAAVAELNTIAPFFLTKDPNSGSLLSIDPDARAEWVGGETLEVVGQRVVPTIRLDTFLERMHIERVDLLKVDAQGSDLAVVASAGNRIKDIDMVVLEVAITASPVYRGAADRHTSIAYMEQRGFELVHIMTQTHNQEQNLTFVQKRRSSLGV
jgi:FkbM family methyltransferase